MREHVNDTYVQQARAQGYRARSAFKLLEIDARDRLLRLGQTVVDLGAAPGGWSQVAAAKVGAKGKVFALDLLEMEPIPGVQFLQGDFTGDAVLVELEKLLEKRGVDLVLSDMAPNISGIGLSDQARSMHLCELALDFATQHLQPEGAFLVKCFQGVGFTEFLQQMRRCFRHVSSRKPDASRGRSTEMYLLARQPKERAG